MICSWYLKLFLWVGLMCKFIIQVVLDNPDNEFIYL